MTNVKKIATENKSSYLRKIVVFAIPLMVTGILQSLYSAADLVIVGRFEGESALAAVGSTNSLTNLILGLFMGFSVGAGVCVAHGIGAKQDKDVSEVLHTSILVALILGVIVSIVGYIFAPQLLEIMDTPEDVIEMASLYARIIFIGAPVSILYNYAAAMLRASGDSKHPLIFLTVSGVANVAMNIILVAVFHIGVAGVAVATITSQAISSVLIVAYLMKNKGVLHFSFSKLKIHKGKMKKILLIGIPSGIQATLFSLSNVIVQSSINSFGSTVVAGNSASSNIEHFFYFAYHAFYDCALTFVGQSVGAKKFKEIKKIVYCCIICIIFFAVILTALGLVFKDALLGLYITDNPEALEAASIRYIIMVTPYFLGGIMETASGTLRGLGRSISSTVISMIFACFFRIVWLLTVFKQYPSPQCVYITYPLSWLLTAAVLLIFVVLAVKKEIAVQKIYDIQYKKPIEK